MDALTLAGGTALPMLGVGLYKVDDADVERVIAGALEVGYTAFDTAAMYGNEAAVGAALERLGATQAVVTTKLLNTEHGTQRTIDAFHRSRDLLRREVIDLYLIHWPAPKQNRFVAAWEAITQLQADGHIRSIGVSNFHVHHLDRLVEAGLPVPAINQVECHPWLAQDELIAVHAQRGIVTQAWSPLARGRILTDPILADIAAAHGVGTAEIALAWQRQRGVATIAKSVQVSRLAENFRSLDVVLTRDELAAIATLENGTRTGVDPDDRD